MKIAILISSLKFGGAEKQAVIDAALLSGDHEVFFLAFQDGELAHQLPETVRYIRLHKSGYFPSALRMARLFKSAKVDVVHAHLFAPMLISGLATLFCKTRSIWNFHSHAYGEGGGVRWAHSLIAWLPGVKRILFPATELKQYYHSEHYAFPQEKELVFFNSGQFLERQPFREGTRGPVILGYVGRVIPLKRLHLLLEAGAALLSEGFSDFRISLVGDGESLPGLKALARELKLEAFVDFHGFQTDTRSYYDSFSLFVLPSEEEVLSLSLIDAQLAGLPCVAFDVGGNADVVSTGKSGYIVKDSEAFISRISQLCRDPRLRLQMGQQAIEHSSDKFSQKARKESLEALYQEAVVS